MSNETQNFFTSPLDTDKIIWIRLQRKCLARKLHDGGKIGKFSFKFFEFISSTIHNLNLCNLIFHSSHERFSFFQTENFPGILNFCVTLQKCLLALR